MQRNPVNRGLVLDRSALVDMRMAKRGQYGERRKAEMRVRESCWDRQRWYPRLNITKGGHPISWFLRGLLCELCVKSLPQSSRRNLAERAEDSLYGSHQKTGTHGNSHPAKAA